MCAPIPAAVPWTAAITGTSQSRMALTVEIAPRSIIRRRSPTTRSGASAGRSDSVAGAPPRRSAPVQKNRPVAWITTQRMARSSSARASHRPIWMRWSLVSALPASGRSKVMVAIPSLTSKRTPS